MNLHADFHAVVRQFQIPGECLAAAPFGGGHINDTYRVAFQHNGKLSRYLIQRINHHVFKQPRLVMENIQRVTIHLAAKNANELEAPRRGLTLIPTRAGAAFFCDAAGNFWRAFIFIEASHCLEIVTQPAHAFAAAKAFGQFQKLLADLPAPPRLHDTIPDFHHTPKRFLALEKAIAADAFNRAKTAQAEIEFALKNKAICSVLLAAQLPERVTHNDAKGNNVLLDDASGEAICVIDLDTVMPGLALYDFGDLVRTMTSPANEAERDLSKITMQLPMFAALARGYLSSANEFLTAAEKSLLAFSGKLITFETGLRFLTDFLEGDHYFKTHRAEQNLDRCRAQFQLVESIAAQESVMNQLVARI